MSRDYLIRLLNRVVGVSECSFRESLLKNTLFVYFNSSFSFQFSFILNLKAMYLIKRKFQMKA